MNNLYYIAKEILELFPYGPHFTPEQNRALASLRAELDHIASGLSTRFVCRNTLQDVIDE